MSATRVAGANPESAMASRSLVRCRAGRCLHARSHLRERRKLRVRGILTMNSLETVASELCADGAGRGYNRRGHLFSLALDGYDWTIVPA